MMNDKQMNNATVEKILRLNNCLKTFFTSVRLLFKYHPAALFTAVK